MKQLTKNCLFLLILITGFSPAEAQLLWEVDGDNLKQKSYLFGTMHTADPRVFEFDAVTLAAFEEAEGMAGELVFDENLSANLIEMMLMPGDTSLSDLLNEEEYDLVMSKLESQLGFFARTLVRVRPIFTMSLLSETQSVSKKTPSVQENLQNEALDMYLQNEARKAGKEVIGLETMDEQMDAFNSISLSSQARMLYESVEKPEDNSGQDGQESLTQIYLSQDIEKLYDTATAEFSPEMNAKMLTERNRRMAGRMNKIIPKKSLFVAVGAAHLGGETGMIRLLSTMGYRLRPLSRIKPLPEGN